MNPAVDTRGPDTLFAEPLLPDAELLLQAKALIFGTRRARVATLQRQLAIDYGLACRVMDLLEREGLVHPVDAEGRRPVNWYHMGWLSISRQPALWREWKEMSVRGSYGVRRMGEHWEFVHAFHDQVRVLASFASEAEALRYGKQWEET